MAKNTVLVADDLADRSPKGRLRSRRIRDWAVTLAKALNLDINLVYVKDIYPHLFRRKDTLELKALLQPISKTIQNQFKKASVRGTILYRAGSPSEEILKEEKSIEVELIVIGTRAKKGLQKLVMGSVAEEVLRHASVPVLVIGPVAQVSNQSLPLKENFQILFLTDLTEGSRKAERFAINLALKLHCSVVVLHSVGEQIRMTRSTLYSSGFIPNNIETLFDDMIIDAEKKLLRKCQTWQTLGVQTTSLLIVKEEPLEKSIVTQAKKGCGFIVMGTQSRSPLLKAFVGSSARTAILKSPIPVFIVRNEVTIK